MADAYSQIVKSSRRSIPYALGGSSASSHGQRFRTGNRLVDQDLGRMSVLCLQHGDDGCFFNYFPGRSSKKRIQMIDDKQRPIDGGGVHLRPTSG